LAWIVNASDGTVFDVTSHSILQESQFSIALAGNKIMTLDECVRPVADLVKTSRQA